MIFYCSLIDLIILQLLNKLTVTTVKKKQKIQTYKKLIKFGKNWTIF